MDKNVKEEMSFLDHLEDLRWHLIRSVFAVLITGSIAFIAKDFIFDQVLFGPKKIDFFTYEVLCNISNFLGFDDSFCINEMPFRIQSRTMSGQFSAHIWMSITAGFILSFPYVIYQFWSFISPGLYENEKSNAKGFISISSFLFFLGVLFGYYVVTPLSINFLGSYSVSNEIFNDFDLSNDKGIVNYFIGDSTFDEIKNKTHIESLEVVTSGPVPPNPSELLMSPKMKTLMDVNITL